MNILLKTFGLLLGALIILPVSFSNAFACMQSPRLFELVDRELVFEGHLVAYEKIKHVDPKDQNKIFYNLVEVYKVDRNWKGTKKGQEIRIVPFDSYSKDGNFQSVNLSAPKEIITVVSNRLSEREEIYLDRIDCPDTFDITWGNRLLLFLKFPLAIFQ